MRYELTDLEWSAIKPFLPNKPQRWSRQAFRQDCRASAISRITLSPQEPVGGIVELRSIQRVGHHKLQSLRP
jgi:hypothetical protein